MNKIIFFLYFLLCVGAIGVHALYAQKSSYDIKHHINKAKKYRYAIIIEASGFDLEQPNCLEMLSQQDYDQNLYDILILQDNTQVITIDHILERVAASAKAYDNIILLDIEDIIPLDFISKMNAAYYLSSMPVQAHKIDSINIT